VSRPFIPRAYQGPGIAHMLDNPRCALHAGTGTGKTVTTLTAADILLLAGESEQILVLGPLRVARDVWTDEALKWEHTKHLRFAKILGTEDQRKAALRQKASIHITNYEQLPWLVKRLGNDWPFDTVIADEATKLKGFRLRQGGARTRALGSVAHKKVRQGFMGASLVSRWRQAPGPFVLRLRGALVPARSRWLHARATTACLRRDQRLDRGFVLVDPG
jgi:hypothetical protein